MLEWIVFYDNLFVVKLIVFFCYDNVCVVFKLKYKVYLNIFILCYVYCYVN